MHHRAGPPAACQGRPEQGFRTQPPPWPCQGSGEGFSSFPPAAGQDFMEASVGVLADFIGCEGMVTSAGSFRRRVPIYLPEAMQCQFQVQVGRVGANDRE